MRVPAETRQSAWESMVELERTTLACSAPAHHCVSNVASFVPVAVAAQIYLVVPVAPDPEASYELYELC